MTYLLSCLFSMVMWAENYGLLSSINYILTVQVNHILSCSLLIVCRSWRKREADTGSCEKEPDWLSEVLNWEKKTGFGRDAQPKLEVVCPVYLFTLKLKGETKTVLSAAAKYVTNNDLTIRVLVLLVCMLHSLWFHTHTLMNWQRKMMD